MTSRSDHEEDMSMEEILASIRKFVTDNPPDDTRKQRVYKGDLSESVVIPPHQGQQTFSAESARSSEPYPHQASSDGHTQQFSASKHHAQTAHPVFEPDILELINPISQSPISGQRAVSDHHAPWTPPSRTQNQKKAFDDTVMTLTSPLDLPSSTQETKRAEKPSRFSLKSSSIGEFEDSLVSSQTISASASSLSRLAQASKTTPKRTANFADQRNITLDQLVQDLIRPMIKQWIDTHLPSLVEEMVAKEIKRITKHLG